MLMYGMFALSFVDKMCALEDHIITKGQMLTPTNVSGYNGSQKSEATKCSLYYSPERTIKYSYHISMLQTLRLQQSLSVDTSWTRRAQICQNDLGETNKHHLKHCLSKWLKAEHHCQLSIYFYLGQDYSRWIHKWFKYLQNEHCDDQNMKINVTLQ